MKQKLFKKFIKFSKISILLFFLGVEFFGFGQVFKPYQTKAACSYRVDFNETNGSNGVTAAVISQKVNFTVKITESDISCVSKVRIVLLSQTQAGDVGLLSQTQSFSNFVAQTNFSFTLSDYKSSFLNPNILKVKVRVLDPGVFNDTQLTESSYWTINIGGSSSGSGYNKIQVFTPGNKEFKAGENVSVWVQISSNFAQDLKSRGIQYVNLHTTINGKSGLADEKQVSVDGLVGGKETTNPPVTPEKNFINGPNNITVELLASNSSPLGSASAVVNVTGLAGTGQPGADLGGTKTPGQDVGGVKGPGGDLGASGVNSSGIDCTTLPKTDPNYAANCLYNPLPADGLTDVLLYIMKAFLGIIGVWAVAFIVIGGFRMVMSQGNEEAITTARKTITWAVVGLLIALLSFAIIAMVQNFLGANVKPVDTTTTTTK